MMVDQNFGNNNFGNNNNANTTVAVLFDENCKLVGSYFSYYLQLKLFPSTGVNEYGLKEFPNDFSKSRSIVLNKEQAWKLLQAITKGTPTEIIETSKNGKFVFKYTKKDTKYTMLITLAPSGSTNDPGVQFAFDHGTFNEFYFTRMLDRFLTPDTPEYHIRTSKPGSKFNKKTENTDGGNINPNGISPFSDDELVF